MLERLSINYEKHNNHLKRLLQTLRFILYSLKDSNPILDAVRIATSCYNCVITIQKPIIQLTIVGIDFGYLSQDKTSLASGSASGFCIRWWLKAHPTIFSAPVVPHHNFTVELKIKEDQRMTIIKKNQSETYFHS